MSDADNSVIQQLESRRQRRQPPPRRPAQGAPTLPELPGSAAGESAAAGHDPSRPRRKSATSEPAARNIKAAGSSPAPSPTASRSSARSKPRGPVASTSDLSSPFRLDRDEPITNYAVRVRRSLDDLVAWRLAELRQHGVRTTKVELTEMLLWELSAATPAELDQRIALFRQHNPR